jgi:hypothetical protein
MARMNCVTKSYTLKYGHIKFCKYDLDQYPEDTTRKGGNFYLVNNKPDDAPLCLTTDQMTLLLEKLPTLQREAQRKQMYIDNEPVPIDCDEIDGPYPKQLYSQEILFTYKCCSFVRAISWLAGRRITMTLESHFCSYSPDTNKLVREAGAIDIDLSEDFVNIKKFVDECK